MNSMTQVSGYALDGFRQLTGGRYTQSFFHYYLAESRSYLRGDKSLCGAYNSLTALWAERRCYTKAC